MSQLPIEPEKGLERYFVAEPVEVDFLNAVIPYYFTCTPSRTLLRKLSRHWLKAIVYELPAASWMWTKIPFAGFWIG